MLKKNLCLNDDFYLGCYKNIQMIQKLKRSFFRLHFPSSIWLFIFAVSEKNAYLNICLSQAPENWQF